MSANTVFEMLFREAIASTSDHRIPQEVTKGVVNFGPDLVDGGLVDAGGRSRTTMEQMAGGNVGGMVVSTDPQCC